MSSREVIQRLKQDSWYEGCACWEPQAAQASGEAGTGHCLHKDRKSDFGVSFPDFPGSITAGRTLEEARRRA
jgi:hypothetical protein